MDIETMPHTMYFTGNLDTVTKINHVPYQTIVCNDKGMFTAKLMNDTPIKIFIENGATPSILPLRTYNRFPVLHTVVLLHCGCLSLIPFIEISIRNNSSSSDVLNIQASISPKFESK